MKSEEKQTESEVTFKNGMVFRGKPREVNRQIQNLIDKYGEDAMAGDVFAAERENQNES